MIYFNFIFQGNSISDRLCIFYLYFCRVQGVYFRSCNLFLSTSISCYNEPVHEISNNVVCVTNKASDQPAHTRSLIRAFASRLIIV